MMSIGSQDAFITASVVPADLDFPDIMTHYPGLYLLLNYYAGFLK
jgi:hypothetical protein